MKSITAACLALLTCVFTRAEDAAALPAPLPATDPSAGAVRVMTYNIFGGRNPDGARDFGRIATVIKTINPDLAALQEIDIGTERLQKRDLLKELAELTGLKPVFAEAMPYQGGSYGIGALCKWPLENLKITPLPTLPDIEPRTSFTAECRLPGGLAFTLVNTHLAAFDGEALRIRQAEALLQATPDAPAVLMGDFNATPESTPMKTLFARWADAWAANTTPGHTVPVDAPRRRIDYILTNSPAWKTTRAEVGHAVFPGNAAWKTLVATASDHQPVMAELELKQAPAPAPTPDEK